MILLLNRYWCLILLGKSPENMVLKRKKATYPYFLTNSKDALCYISNVKFKDLSIGTTQ